MMKLSTGDDSTLGAYRKLSVAFFGEASRQVAFLDEKINGSPNGENEEVIANEGQMLMLLMQMDGGAA